MAESIPLSAAHPEAPGDASARSSICAYCHLPVRATRDLADDSEPLYCCYGCRFAAGITSGEGESGAATWLLTRLGVSAFLSMGVMIFSLSMYSLDIYDLDAADAGASAGAWIGLVRYILLILSAPVIALLGLPIASSAAQQWRTGVRSADGLVALGVFAAFALSALSTFRDAGPIYYETACMVLVLVTLGRYLEASGRVQAAGAIDELNKLLPDEVSVRKDDREERTPLVEVRPDDILLIRAGERIGADAVVISGKAAVDESVVTGESIPIEKSDGDALLSGTVNVDGYLEARVVAQAEDGTFGRLRSALETARLSRSRYERLADRVAGWFLRITIAAAVLGLYLGVRRGGTGEGVLTALSVVLIACPCALGIATPMAIWIALGRAARAGVLFRSGEALERLAGIRAAAFDKTGTLTAGSVNVVSAWIAPGTASASLQAAADLAASSTHAHALAVRRALEDRGTESVRPIASTVVPGRGIEAVRPTGDVLLGSLALLESRQIELEPSAANFAERAIREGHSVTAFAEHGACRAVFALEESPRNEARDALARLSEIGVPASILSGDDPSRTERLARSLGVAGRGGLRPEGKLSALRDIRSEFGAVAMIGDGINDAPALAAADVGIAMGCGADITRDAGAVCLPGNDLCLIPWSIELSRSAVRKVRQNLFWAFFYNAIGMALALMGYLMPVFAALAMVVSSAIVVTNSLSLRRAPIGTTPAEPIT